MFNKNTTTYTCSQCGRAGHNKQTCGKSSTHPINPSTSVDKEYVNNAVKKKELQLLAKRAEGKLKRDKDGEYYIQAKNVETTRYGTLETETRIRPEDVEEQFRYGGVVELHMGKNSYDSTIPTFKPHSKRLGEEKLTMYKVGDFVYVLASLFGLKRFLPKEVRHLKKGVYHNEHGPAVYTEKTRNETQLWYINGVKYRNDGGPSSVEKFHWLNPSGDEGGILERKMWTNAEGHLYRKDGPAIIETRRDRAGNILTKRESWYVDGFGRLDGPTEITYNGNGEITDEQWDWRGKRSFSPDACRKAVLPNLTDKEFYELCTHKDYVVRQLAAHNPNCPQEFKVVVDIVDD